MENRFTIQIRWGYAGSQKEMLIFSKESADGENEKHMAIEVLDIPHAPFLKKRINPEHIRSIAELFTTWAEELEGINNE